MIVYSIHWLIIVVENCGHLDLNQRFLLGDRIFVIWINMRNAIELFFALDCLVFGVGILFIAGVTLQRNHDARFLKF